MPEETAGRARTGRATAPRVPRPVIWVVLLAAAAAVALAGLIATGAVVIGVGGIEPPAPRVWIAFIVACGLTIVSLSLRSLRWIFLLRRADTRIPIRDAYIGYFAGFSLLFVPLLLGEIAARARVNWQRGRVPVATTALVNVWERVLDVLALGLIASAGLYASGERLWWMWLAPVAIAVLSIGPVRKLAITLARTVVTRLVSIVMPSAAPAEHRLVCWNTWWVALSASVAAWLLPGLGFWLLTRTEGLPLSATAAEQVYASSAAFSGISLVPGGVLVAGSQMLAVVERSGVPVSTAVVIVLAARLATAGLSLLLGLVFVVVHLRSIAADSAVHFDDIADAYDVQIPESRRHALLDRKTTLMREVIEARHVGRIGLDVGCGQGAYVARMRRLGFDVRGIDASSGQVAYAGRNIGDPSLVQVGSVLDIPAADGTFDFLYIINVLHHLGSVDEQRRAFTELFRVLKPGGLLFVHEINTRNLLFRFYMGYVFPSLNCIDEGVERWLLPHRLSQYTDAAVVDVRYFTFLPDFVPRGIVQLFAPIERWLERSRWAPYSAHYMAVLVNGSPKASAGKA
ncbi:MAG: methyltransferase domain-containing protein [Acidobacteriaceae bacterium]|jgi:ubiquinone/menaquinone biosynthesis C-methylase UbiE/uncharacterized membrane protein YbhN (UPF0104 family)|nr:methyltransferase domain-containing protein [Acidobacteriaceae bacterium]